MQTFICNWTSPSELPDHCVPLYGQNAFCPGCNQPYSEVSPNPHTVLSMLSVFVLLTFTAFNFLNFFETGSRSVTRAGLELTAVLWPQPPKQRGDRCAAPHPADTDTLSTFSLLSTRSSLSQMTSDSLDFKSSFLKSQHLRVQGSWLTRRATPSTLYLSHAQP